MRAVLRRPQWSRGGGISEFSSPPPKSAGGMERHLRSSNRLHVFPALSAPTPFDGSEYFGNAQNIEQAGLSLLTGGDGLQELVSLDDLQIFITHAVRRPWVKRG